jgi:hypothetical protein
MGAPATPHPIAPAGGLSGSIGIDEGGATEDALTDLLMSWYYAGYYAGRYKQVVDGGAHLHRHTPPQPPSMTAAAAASFPSMPAAATQQYGAGVHKVHAYAQEAYAQGQDPHFYPQQTAQHPPMPMSPMQQPMDHQPMSLAQHPIQMQHQPMSPAQHPIQMQHQPMSPMPMQMSTSMPSSPSHIAPHPFPPPRPQHPQSLPHTQRPQHPQSPPQRGNDQQQLMQWVEQAQQQLQRLHFQQR